MTPIYDDGRYAVSATAISTPTKLYPLVNASVRVRRDLFWAAGLLAALSCAAINIYGDLLTPKEVSFIAALPLMTAIVAFCIGMIAIDAPGHASTIVFVAPWKTRKIFNAIRRAKLADSSAPTSIHTSPEDFGK